MHCFGGGFTYFRPIPAPMPWLEFDGGRAARPDGGRVPDGGLFAPEFGLLLPRFELRVVPEGGRADVGLCGCITEDRSGDPPCPLRL